MLYTDWSLHIREASFVSQPAVADLRLQVIAHSGKPVLT